MKHVVLALSLHAIACGGDSGLPIADAGDGDADDCADPWQVWRSRTQETTVAVEGGRLQLVADPNGTGRALQVVRTGLLLDFDVEIDFTETVLAGDTTSIWAQVHAPDESRYVYAELAGGFDGFPLFLVGADSVSQDSGSVPSMEPLTALIHIARVGEAATVEVFYNGLRLAQAQAVLPGQGVELWIGMGAYAPPSGPVPMAANIPEVRITSAAGDMSDTFDCDSLGPVRPLP